MAASADAQVLVSPAIEPAFAELRNAMAPLLLNLSRAAADEDAGLAFERTRLDLGALARSEVGRWSGDAQRRRIDLGAEVRGPAWVQGDATQLEVLLGNLIENALRYTPAGGVVDVVAETLEGAPTLRVIDNGPGVAEADRVRVFDRFYRSPEAIARDASGSGLGLAIVKAIADKHRAQVSLHEGHAGIGLEVKSRFPFGLGLPTRAHAEPTRAMIARQGRRTLPSTRRRAETTGS
jgi:signal transduction histidine kinase